MSTDTRLSQIFEAALEIPVTPDSKLVLFSDCHRGDNSLADDFAHNQSLFFFALSHYLENGFTYIELGDGDELLENRHFSDIRNAHSHVFWLMSQFHQDNRLYLLWGNHDGERRDPTIVEKTLYHYVDDRTGEVRPLFEGIQVHEGLILSHAASRRRALLVHGHQGDIMNDSLYPLSKFLVRHLWRHLQLLGVPDPTSPAKNEVKQRKRERLLVSWVQKHGHGLIAGHTHRPRFPSPGELPYLNDGSCVHPRSITGIEIENGTISLIKWEISTNDDGILQIVRVLLEGPQKLILYKTN